MARREWADKLADAQTCPQCAEQYGMGDNGDIVHAPSVARLLRKEHARAARIVREVVKHAAHMERQTKVNREMNAYWQGKLDGAENILAGLRKGRT